MRIGEEGPSGVKGYFSVKSLKSTLTLLGITENVVNREVKYLLQAKCLTAEHLREDTITDEDLVSLAPAGTVHLELIERTFDYFAAIAEDTWISDESIAYRIASRIKSQHHLELNSQLYNARDIIKYLEYKTKKRAFQPSFFLNQTTFDNLIKIDNSIKSVDAFFEDQAIKDPWLTVNEKYKIGEIINGRVKKNHERYGIFVEIEPGVDGLVHKSNFSQEGFEEKLVYGHKVRVKIITIRHLEKRISLEIESSPFDA